MLIYKYTDKHALDILRDCRIKVSSAEELNDPFELTPKIDAEQFGAKYLNQLLTQPHKIDEAYAKDGASNGFTNKRKFKRWYLNNLDARIAEIKKPVSENVEQVKKKFAADSCKIFRLFCASKRSDSILMWSHYANKHQGAVIEFDTAREPFAEMAKNKLLFDIIYSEKRADFHYNPKKSAQFKHAVFTVVKTKAASWIYEEEIRALIPVEFCKQAGFVDLDPNAIKSVIFGCRCPAPFRREIQKFLAETRYAHVATQSAILARESFSLEFATTPM